MRRREGPKMGPPRDLSGFAQSPFASDLIPLEALCILAQNFYLPDNWLG